MRTKPIWNYGNGHRAKDVYSIEGLAPTITTGNHGLGTAIMEERDGEIPRGDGEEDESNGRDSV